MESAALMSQLLPLEISAQFSFLFQKFKAITIILLTSLLTSLGAMLECTSTRMEKKLFHHLKTSTRGLQERSLDFSHCSLPVPLCEEQCPGAAVRGVSLLEGARWQ